MQKIFKTNAISVFKSYSLLKCFNKLCNFSIVKLQSANFAEKSIFTRFLDLRKKLEGDSFISKIVEHKITPRKEIEEAENILLSVIESKDKTKIQEIIPEVRKILHIQMKNRYYSKQTISLVYTILRELQGQDFPFFLVPDYILYIQTFERRSPSNFPSNFVSDFEKHFYEKAVMLKIKELSLLFSLTKILTNQFSSNFLPFLENIILLNINNEKFLYLKSCDAIMNDVRRNALYYTSNTFLDEYLSVYLKMISSNTINYKEYNHLIRSLNKKIKSNYFDFEMRDVITKFLEGSREIMQGMIEDESFYEQDLFIAFLMISKVNFLNGIFPKSFYNSIVKKIITKDLNKMTIVNLINYLPDLPGISNANVEKVDLHLIQFLKNFKELRDFYLALKYAKKYNNHYLVDIVFLHLAKYMLENREVDYFYFNAIYNFKQNYKLFNSVNRFSMSVLELFMKKNPKKSMMNEERIEQIESQSVENLEENVN